MRAPAGSIHMAITIAEREHRGKVEHHDGDIDVFHGSPDVSSFTYRQQMFPCRLVVIQLTGQVGRRKKRLYARESAARKEHP